MGEVQALLSEATTLLKSLRPANDGRASVKAIEHRHEWGAAGCRGGGHASDRDGGVGQRADIEKLRGAWYGNGGVTPLEPARAKEGEEGQRSGGAPVQWRRQEVLLCVDTVIDRA